MNRRAIVPAATATLFVALCGALYGLGYREQYASILSLWGAAPFRFPFLDTHAVLSAVRCHRLGVDVYAENPCDVFGRIHVYSPLWLALSVFPITTAWTPFVGLALVALFLVSLVLLPAGRGRREVCVITLATISGAVAFALERANNDLVIFILAVLIVRLMQCNQVLRWFGYAGAVLAAMLKFYPAVLLVLATRERLLVLLAVGVAVTAALAGFVALDFHDLMRVLPAIPTTSYFDAYVFGARDLPFGLAQTLGWSHAAAMALFALLTIAMIGCAAVSVSRGDLVTRIAALTELERSALLAGCLLVLACFFTAQNVLYRGIHCLFVLPALTVLARPSGERQGSGLALLGTVLVLVLMFWEAIRLSIGWVLQGISIPLRYQDAIQFNVWLIRELSWWIVAAILASLLLSVVAYSRAWDELRSLARFCW